MPKSMLVVLLILFAGCDARSTPTRSDTPPTPSAADPDSNLKTAHLVPPAHVVRLDVPMTGAFAEITGADRLIEATRFILALEGSPRFTQPEDRMIFSFLREYMEGRRKFRYHVGDREMKAADGQLATAGYHCGGDIYWIKAGLRPSTLALALILYHEVGHAVLCESLITAAGLSRTEAQRQMQAAGACVEEYASWAAQVRLFAAVLDRGDPRDVLSATEELDLTVLGRTLHAWHALAANRFCAWYAQTR